MQNYFGHVRFEVSVPKVWRISVSGRVEKNALTVPRENNFRSLSDTFVKTNAKKAEISPVRLQF
jgi:hypothetical protein